MGFRFRKSIKIAPGIKLNFNKKSTGITIGGKGAHYTVNSKGKRTASVGIPGTGLSYSESFGGEKSKKRKKPKKDGLINTEVNNMKTKLSKKGCLPVAIIGVVLACVIGACGGGDDIEEITTEITTVIESVITTEHIPAPTTLVIETTTVKETTEPTTTQKLTTTTTEKETTTEKKTATTQKETTTEKKTTTTKKVTTTEKKTTTTKKATTTKATTTKAPTTTKKVTTTKKPTTTKKVTMKQNGKTDGKTVYVTPNGERYHLDPDCPGKNGYAVSIDEVGSRTACKKCAQ